MNIPETHIIENLKSEIASLRTEVCKLKEQIDWFKRQIFVIGHGVRETPKG